MSTTYGDLQTEVARKVRDTGATTFSADDIKDFILSNLAQIGRVAPRLFQEDLDIVDGQFEYTLLTADFDTAVPEIELIRVEVWDTTVTPSKPVSLVAPAAGEYTTFSNVGWRCRGGILELPYRTVVNLDADNDLLRVWGYAPYAVPTADDDILGTSFELTQAVALGCQVEAFRRLVSSRALFRQWQTHAGNSDVSLAQLAQDLNLLLSDWNQTKRDLRVIREAP